MSAVRNLAFLVILVGVPGASASQDSPGPGDGPRPPAPPAPVAPREDRTPPRPPPPTTRGMSILGRIITGFPELGDEIIEVRIETAGRVRIGFAYTDGTGEFEFRDVQLQPGEFYYVIVEEEGFEPYRERLTDFVHPTFGGYLAIFLRPERTEPAESTRGGDLIVDLGQLALDIPDDVREDFDDARRISGEGRYAEAGELLESVVERVPEFYDALEALGMNYFHLGRLEDARDVLLRAHEISPQSPGALLNLGTVLYNQGESVAAAGDSTTSAELFQSSADRLREAIDRDPFSAPAHLRLGSALYKLGDLDLAEAALLRALEFDPGLIDSRLMLANVYIRQSKFREALIETELFLEAGPESPYRPAVLEMQRQLGPLLDRSTPAGGF